MQPGQFKPGSTTATVLALIAAGNGQPVARAAIRAALPKAGRHHFARSLDALAAQHLVRETCAGFVPAWTPPAVPPEPASDPLPGLSAEMRPRLAAIIDRAHAYRRAGAPSLGASLLGRAAQRIALPHVRADLLALADLFFHHPKLFPGATGAPAP